VPRKTKDRMAVRVSVFGEPDIRPLAERVAGSGN
jgi:hypothetical protein